MTFYIWIRTKFKCISIAHRAIPDFVPCCFSELISKPFLSHSLCFSLRISCTLQVYFHCRALLLFSLPEMFFLTASEVFLNASLWKMPFLTTLHKIYPITVYPPCPHLFFFHHAYCHLIYIYLLPSLFITYRHCTFLEYNIKHKNWSSVFCLIWNNCAINSTEHTAGS